MPPPSTTEQRLTPAQLFDLADAARDAGDFETAETAYRALASNPDIGLRNEARFRLAMMFADRMQRPADAAILLREILDEQPDVARVRLELARMHAQLGNLDAADRELRAAQAAGLPPEVERLVRFFSSTLTNRSKPLGLNVEVALAPDTNINRATRSDTLETIIGDFDLSDDAKATSGIGLSARLGGYARVGLDKDVDLLLRPSFSARLYEKDQFNDIITGVQAGPQISLGRDRLNVSALATWRWFGGDPYSFSYGVSGDYRHPLSKRAQMRIDSSFLRSDDKLNDLRDADRFSLAVGVDRSFDARTGGGLRLSGHREVAADPGYSTAGGGLDAYAFREVGKTTLVARLGYDRIEADQRLLLYPRRRQDDRFSGGLAATLRGLRIGRLAPQIRVNYEKSFSTIEIYEYSRLSAELGFVAAF